MNHISSLLFLLINLYIINFKVSLSSLASNILKATFYNYLRANNLIFKKLKFLIRSYQILEVEQKKRKIAL